MVQTLAGRDVRDGICSASDIQGHFAQNEFGPSFRKKKLLSLQSHSLNKLSYFIIDIQEEGFR
jgi:hypothetical protein